MQVKRIAAPVEAHGSWFGSAGAFVSVGAHVASFTLAVDDYTGWPEVQPSVWVALPFGRDVLIGACMAAGGVDVTMLAAMSPDEVRAWALEELLHSGTSKAKDELDSQAYRDGYPRDRVAREFLAVLVAQLDRAFGFDADPATVAAHVPATRPAPARTLVTV